MQQDSVVRARNLPADQAGEMVGFTREEAGWEWMSFVVTRLLPGQSLDLRTGDEEMVLVWLGGRCVADWGAGAQSVGARANVFDGLPRCTCQVKPCHREGGNGMRNRAVPRAIQSEARAAAGDAKRRDDRFAWRRDSSRQIVGVIPSDFAADKLVVFEVYTPGGNWSSYPAHKHDVDQPPVEVDLDEIYYYRMRGGRGFAYRTSIVRIDHGVAGKSTRRRRRSGQGWLPPGGCRTRLRYLLPQLFGRHITFHDGDRRPRACLAPLHLEAARSTPTPGTRLTKPWCASPVICEGTRGEAAGVSWFLM